MTDNVDTDINSWESKKIQILLFSSIFLLTWIHSMNTPVFFSEPVDSIDTPMNLLAFIEVFISHGFLRWLVPLFFICSGYFFARQEKKECWHKLIQHRIHTLLIPYLIWSAIGLAVALVFQNYPAWGLAITFNPGFNIAFLYSWLFSSEAYQLWYIRYLIVFCVIYKPIKFLVKKPSIYFFSTIVLMMFVYPYFIYKYNLNSFYHQPLNGFTFFSFGVWLCLSSSEDLLRYRFHHGWMLIVSFSLICLIKTLIMFNGRLFFGSYAYFIIVILHNCSIIIGIVTIWYTTNSFVKWCFNQPFILWLAQFSFVIYGFHAPLINKIMLFFLNFTWHLKYSFLIGYLFLPILVNFICVFFGVFLKRCCPAFYFLSTGGRTKLRDTQSIAKSEDLEDISRREKTDL